MVMNFDNIPLQHIPHFKGGEGEVLARIHTDEMGKIVHLTLPPGASIGLHTHDTSAEVVYFLSGHGIVLEDDAPNGDPISVEFCHKLGLAYVSCSPFRVPIARLAAAQAAIKNK